MVSFFRNVFLGALTLSLIGLAQADLSIEFSTEGVRQIPIAVFPFGAERDLNSLVSPVISADLVRSGLFRAVDTSSASPVPTETSELNVSQWRAKQAEALVIGKTMLNKEGRVQIRFTLIDAATGAEKLSEEVTVGPQQIRLGAHRVADAIYEKLIGERGVFSTKIAYVTKEGAAYQLKVADADGFGERTVLNSKEPIISPKWSPDGKRMAYVTFELKKPLVVVQNLSSGQRKIVANFYGNNSAPAWSPDGRKLALALSKDGIAQIYVMDAEGEESPRRLMTSKGIDTEPCFSPDGQMIYFTSDRGGSPQIYRIPASGGVAQRLSFQGNYNVSPRVSPDGKKMVYIQQNGSAFRVMLQDFDTNQTLSLSDNALDESPSFSPNGRMILYATRTLSRGSLALVSVDGRIKQKLSTQSGDVYEPAWGPLPDKKDLINVPK